MFHKHIILSGLQSAIKIIFWHLIILAAVRKGYKRSSTWRILKCDIAYTSRENFFVYRRDVMTQCHARISRENLPVPLKLENIIMS